MKNRIRIISIALVVLLVLGAVYYFWDGKKTLNIQTRNGTITYQVERAVTTEQQKKGLMYRTSLAQKNGMIFLFDPIRVVHMWMKDTLIPLDMVFFDRQGRVVHVHHNAHPQDLTVISSGRPVAGVLEINAGEAKKHSIDLRAKIDLESVR